MRLFRVAFSGLLRHVLLMPRERMMALDHGHGLAPFVCGRSLKKRRVDQHKRMQLILEPRWLVPPPSAHCNRPLHCPINITHIVLGRRLLEPQHAIQMTPQRTTWHFGHTSSGDHWWRIATTKRPSHAVSIMAIWRIYRRAVCGDGLPLARH